MNEWVKFWDAIDLKNRHNDDIDIATLEIVKTMGDRLNEKAEKWDELEESIAEIALALNIPEGDMFKMRRSSMAITKALSYKNKLESIKKLCHRYTSGPMLRGEILKVLKGSQLGEKYEE